MGQTADDHDQDPDSDPAVASTEVRLEGHGRDEGPATVPASTWAEPKTSPTSSTSGNRPPEASSRRSSHRADRGPKQGVLRLSPRSPSLQRIRSTAAALPSPSFSRTAELEESGYWGDVEEQSDSVARVGTDGWSEVPASPWQMAQEQVRQAPARQPGEGVTVVLDVVTDIVCPYSYIGHLKIAKAIEAARKASSPIDVVVYHHPFQLDASLPEDHTIDRDERLTQRYKDKLPAFVDSINRKGKSVGVELKPGGPIRQTTNAHRLMMLAAQRGGPALQLPFVTALYASYWEDLDDPGDPDMLADKAARARLFHDRDEAKEWILGDDMRDELRVTYAKMKKRGIKGVPFIVINRKFAICGAQEPEELLELFKKVSRGEPPARSMLDSGGNHQITSNPATNSHHIPPSPPSVQLNTMLTHESDRTRPKMPGRVASATRVYQSGVA